MSKTARDLILELYKNDHITKEETDLLLDAINKPPQTITVPITTQPDWTYDPYRPGQPWYTVTSTNSTGLHGVSNTTTSDNQNNING